MLRGPWTSRRARVMLRARQTASASAFLVRLKNLFPAHLTSLYIPPIHRKVFLSLLVGANQAKPKNPTMPPPRSSEQGPLLGGLTVYLFLRLCLTRRREPCSRTKSVRPLRVFT